MNLDFLKTYKWEEMYKEKAHVLAMFMAMDSRTKLMQESVGISFKVFVLQIKNNVFTAFFNLEDAVKISKFILDKILHEKAWIENVFKEIYKRAETLITFSRSLIGKDYSKLTNQELWELYSTFVDKFNAMRIYSSIPTNLEHGTNMFTNYLQEKLGEYVEKGTEAFNEVFSVLTTPNKSSYVKEQEIGLFRLGLHWGKKGFDRELEEHTKKFTWVNYTFQGVPLTREDFLAELKKKIAEGVDFEEELKRIAENDAKLAKKQNNLIGKYKLGEELVRLFSYAKEFVYLKFFRKANFSESYYCVEFLLNEIAKRLKTNLDMVRGMLFNEVKEALLENKIDLDKVRKRIEDSMLLSYQGKTFDLPKEYWEVVLKNIKEKFEGKEISELKGQTACIGKAKGKIKIINSVGDMFKMEEGDIMVSRSTNLDLVPAMKKAAAIVTDLGGLTCHAAIVSREMKKPCIVGTEIATKALEDGDLVEVDASKGIVRRVKS